MLSFENDYSEGACEAILARLLETNYDKVSGYGSDKYCDMAKEKIRKACDCPEAEIFFLVGGTQTNQTVIDSFLTRYEGVLGAETAHINQHEAGAIEAFGHKVLALPHSEGKICSKDVRAYLEKFYGDDSHEHMVFPGMVYISQPSEYGTIYSKSELSALYDVCKEYDIPLYIDGARLGYGLMSKSCDMTLAELAKLCDVFYIGGTKVGALCGEAVVFTGRRMPKHFLTTVKQHGALMAKGRLLGIQFDTLFTDNLYFELSRHAIEMADKLKDILAEKGYEFFIDSPTNQIFIKLENSRYEELKKHVKMSFWESVGDTHTVVRIATSWATTQEDVVALSKVL